MDALARATFLITQAAALNATVAGMQAANSESIRQGRPMMYHEHDFEQAIVNHSCGHNQVLQYLAGA